MSLHYLVKYLCSENHHAQKVIEANCHVRLSNSKNCFIIYVWENIHYLIQFTYKMMFTPAILKIPLSAVHNCCSKEKMVHQNAVHDGSRSVTDGVSLSVTKSKQQFDILLVINSH